MMTIAERPPMSVERSGDKTDHVTKTTDPLNHQTTITYNAAGQSTAVQGPIATEPPTAFAYDTDGNLAATIDPLGNKTQRLYDAVSRLIALTDPLEFDAGDPNLYAYVFNNPTNYIDPSGEIPAVAKKCLAGLIKAIAKAAGINLVGRKPGAGGDPLDPLAAAQSCLMGGGSNKAKGSPPIKPGSANGPAAGNRFPQNVIDAAKKENPTATCVYCRMEGTASQINHAIPRARGGNPTIDNAQRTCPHCNASKGKGNFPKTPPAGYRGPWPPLHW